MLTETELPGFPTADDRARCPGCERLLFASEDEWTEYQPGELEAWEGALSSYVAPEGEKVPDSHGKIGNHKDTCVYFDLPHRPQAWHDGRESGAREDPAGPERIRVEVAARS